MVRHFQRRWAWWAILAAFTVLIGWSWKQLAASRAAAETVAADLQQCQVMADQIKRLSSGPQKASLEAHSIQGLARAIERSAKEARLPVESLTGINPQPSQRLGATPYREQPIRLMLRDVTIRQLVLFLDSLTQCETIMKVADLWLYAPEADSNTTSAEDTWGAELTLTHFIFSPPTLRAQILGNWGSPMDSYTIVEPTPRCVTCLRDARTHGICKTGVPISAKHT